MVVISSVKYSAQMSKYAEKEIMRLYLDVLHYILYNLS